MGESGQRLGVVGVPLTAGLALAFIDQTLEAVTDAGTPAVVAVVEQERRKAMQALSSLRRPGNERRTNERRTVRAAWAEVVVDFVDGVNSRDGHAAWAALRNWVQEDSADDGATVDVVTPEG